MNKVIVITGPTGIGKTELSLNIVKKYNGEIINADASQFKKDLNIGTAKIDLSKIDVKHHLIDVISSTEMYSINDYQVNARNLINEISNSKKIPFLVGGSGLYINACLNDYSLDAPKHSEEYEKKYASYSNEELHNVLKDKDYLASMNIHCNNRRRVIRAIELAESGKNISDNKDGNKSLYDCLIICLNTDRNILYDRINERCKLMLDSGWIEECINLKKSGVDLQTIKDIGYSDIGLYLDGLISFDVLYETISQKTRNYAKRQITWMKNKMNSIFIDMDYNNMQNTISKIELLIDEFLNRK